MARKTFEFRRQAVELYRSTPGATLRGIAIDLGITRLGVWRRAGAWQAIEELLTASEHVRQLQVEAAEPQ